MRQSWRDMSKSPTNILSAKKSVHINLDKETHAELRGILFKHDLTMQDFFSACAERLALEDNVFCKFINTIREKKLDRSVKKLSDYEADRIFDLLEDESPV